jgi:hypothetical protein
MVHASLDVESLGLLTTVPFCPLTLNMCWTFEWNNSNNLLASMSKSACSWIPRVCFLEWTLTFSLICATCWYWIINDSATISLQYLPCKSHVYCCIIDLRTICERLYPLVIQRSELENPPIFQKGKSSWAMASWQQTVDIWLIYGFYGALNMVYISQ